MHLYLYELERIVETLQSSQLTLETWCEENSNDQELMHVCKELHALIVEINDLRDF